MSDGDAKYRKLATEYAKLKAQLPVLKKAILDEQHKEGTLKDEIKEKDQSIRKSEQELESLVFRNDQLSKRVAVLQDELNRTQSTKQKSRSRADTASDNSSSNSLLNEELQRKIRENERLHTELSQIKQETDNQIMLLGDKVDSLEFSEKKHSKKMEMMNEEQKSQLDKLREEKALLEVRVETQERTVREAKLAASLAEDRLQRVEKEMAAELSQARQTIQNKIPFNDTKTSSLNVLNVPTHNRRYQVQVRNHLKQMNTYIRDFSEHMSSVFSYLDQRYHIYPSLTSSTQTITNVNGKLCTYLKGAPVILKSVTEEFRKFSENQPDDVVLTLDTASNLHMVTDEFSRFNNYMKKILSYLTISLAEENMLSLSTQTISDQNIKTSQALHQFSNSLDKTNSYLKLLASQSKTSDHPKANQVKMLNLFSNSLSQLYQSSKGLGVAYSMKSQLETQLPTVPESLSTTDQCLLKSLVSTTAALSKLSTFVTEHYESSSDKYLPLLQTSGDKHDPVVTSLQAQSAEYIKLIQQPVAPSVPYDVALENMKTLFSSTESRESLHEQVKKLNSKASKLEQEKEHWMLEAQLLRIKFDKLQKSQTENGLSSNSSANDLTSGQMVTDSDTTSVPVKTTQTAAGELGAVNHTHISSEEATRESLLKAHLNKRIEELTLQFQQADSRSVAYHAECRALGRRLQISNKARTKAQDELTQANSTISHLQDELVTTKKSYDAQLMTMSEALASMNGNLASQQDNIEELKIQLRNAKKGKK